MNDKGVNVTRLSRRSTRPVLFGLSVALIVLTMGSGAMRGSAATTSTGALYYLALGDSLAQGVQPTSAGASVPTDQGYADDLYTFERTQISGLLLAKLGCPGESTTTMRGHTSAFPPLKSPCSYAPYSSQLAAAVAFLQSHTVAFVTLDIGANNVDGCLSAGIDPVCVAAGFKAAATDLPTIVRTLHTAAPAVPIYAMNYYDPFLAAWLQGSTGETSAQESVCLTTGYPSPSACGLPAGSKGFDGLLDSVYARQHARVADVASAFQTNTFTTVPGLNLPLNVVLVCAWTWMCTPPPVGPNVHANAVGYAVIAATFARIVSS